MAVKGDELSTQLQKSKVRVLVCDDSKIVRLTAKKTLAERFDLLLVEDGEKGWEAICSDNTIQVVFTDLQMPNLDGFGLLERIRNSDDEHIRNMPVIVITGSGDNEAIQQRIVEAGATDLISKPFKSATLIARCEAHSSYRQTKKALEKVTTIDAGTGTLNRQGFDEQLDRDCSFVNRHGASIALVLLELEGLFDQLSARNAEVVVKQVAKILMKSLRKEDSLSRVGQARFSIVLPTAGCDSVVKLVQRLAKKVNSLKIKKGASLFDVHSMAGIAAATKGQNVTPGALLELAEQALESALLIGPGEVQLRTFEAPSPEAQTSEVQISEALSTEVTTAQADEACSVDAVLASLGSEGFELDQAQLDALVMRLQPLVALMTQSQKQCLLSP
ncbi:MAG: hypothetical protein COA42_07710 [Alteromonadaceae bacterium]|nr:MAG: hypothetical protein COA42_07710 [Alteromonadaceae bacterium]